MTECDIGAACHGETNAYPCGKAAVRAPAMATMRCIAGARPRPYGVMLLFRLRLLALGRPVIAVHRHGKTLAQDDLDNIGHTPV